MKCGVFFPLIFEEKLRRFKLIFILENCPTGFSAELCAFSLRTSARKKALTKKSPTEFFDGAFQIIFYY